MPVEPRHRAGLELDGEQPVEVDRPRHRHLAARNSLEAERAIIRFVADQDDCRRTGLLRSFQRDAHQLAADADILVIRPNRQRPEHQRPALAGGNTRHPHRRDDRAVISRDERQRPLVRPAFADLVGGARETPRPEGLFVDVIDFRVVRRVFRQVDDVGSVHGLCIRCEEEGFAAHSAAISPVSA